MKIKINVTWKTSMYRVRGRRLWSIGGRVLYILYTAKGKMIQIVSISPPHPRWINSGNVKSFQKEKGGGYVIGFHAILHWFKWGTKKKERNWRKFKCLPSSFKDALGIAMEMASISKDSRSFIWLGRLRSSVFTCSTSRAGREREKSGSQAGEREREREYQQKNKVK